MSPSVLRVLLRSDRQDDVVRAFRLIWDAVDSDVRRLIKLWVPGKDEITMGSRRALEEDVKRAMIGSLGELLTAEDPLHAAHELAFLAAIGICANHDASTGDQPAHRPQGA